jgi:hypothetical protein
MYQITEDGNHLVKVPGTVTTYAVTNLPLDDGTHQYSVYALWSGNQSDTAPFVNAQTRHTPLDANYLVNYRTVRSSDPSLVIGAEYPNTWTFSPSCAGNICEESLKAGAPVPFPLYAIGGSPLFTVNLKLSSGHYVGTAKEPLFACDVAYSGMPEDTVRVDIAPARVTEGRWSAFKGTVDVIMPRKRYYSIPNEYCPAETWNFTVSGAQ